MRVVSGWLVATAAVFSGLLARRSSEMRMEAVARACHELRGPLDIDPIARRVWIQGEPVELSKKEFALLRALASEPTRVFTREELLRGVWGFRAMGQTRTLDSHAFRLRRKLNTSGDRFVVNVWGVGYKLVDGAIE